MEDTVDASFRQFTASLLEQSINNVTANVVLSPLSLFAVLSMLWLGSKGKTSDELKHSLKLFGISEEVFQRDFDRNYSHLLLDPNFKVANLFYLQEGVIVRERYADLCLHKFKTQPKVVDFGRPWRVAEEANRWVSSHTNEKIEKIVDPHFFTPDMGMTLLNAVYFRARWTRPFPKEGTSMRGFWIAPYRSIPVEMMYQINYFKHGYLSKPKAEIIELPFRGTNQSMIVLCPSERNGIKKVLEHWEKAVEGVMKAELSWDKVELMMPKFSIDYELNLRTIFEKMGIRTAFSDIADFGNIFETTFYRRLKLSQGIHKAQIRVDETGAEEALVENNFDTLTPSMPYEFFVNRPFAFFVVDSRARRPFFAGVIRELKMNCC